MLDFTAITLADKPVIDAIMQRDGTISSGRTFTSLFIWGEHYQTCICLHEGILFFKACNVVDVLTYYMPLGDDMARAIELIEQDAHMQGMAYEIILVNESGKAEIESLFPDKFEFSEQRDQFDYIYNAEDMMSLKGKKYHGKRNFINRFKMAHAGQWRYEPLDPVADYDEILDFVCQWCESQGDENRDDYRYEYSAIQRALKHYEALNIRGGKLILNDKLIAFTLASPQNEQAIDVLIEKADADIEGAYQMINNEFAMREFSDYKYVNREEDMGIDGLRQAKLSYHPAFLTAKYKAVPKK